jgi:hypothetical protein
MIDLRHSNTEFVSATPADECAPAVEAPAPFAVTAGATNSSSCGGALGTTAKSVNKPSPVLQAGDAGSAPGPQDSIPEAGPCGFAFDINSIPDMARR